MRRLFRCSCGYRWGPVDIQDCVTVGCPACSYGSVISCQEVPSIPGFEIVDFVGEGGMGRVFKARKEGFDRVLAVKLVKRDRTTQLQVARFLTEAYIISRVAHPNILSPIWFGEMDNQAFAVMDFVEGSDLGALVKDRGPLPVHQASDYVQQACSALDCLHRRGIVHRDIKPRNILLTSNGVVKVIDCDLAKVVGERILEETGCDSPHGSDHEATADYFTPPGTMLGTLAFAAPEQVADPRQVTTVSDIYSLGVTFYYLLTGVLPFRGDSVAAMLSNLKSHQPDSVDKLRPDIPTSVAAIVRKMMAKRQRKRYQTAAEVVTALTGASRRG